MKKSARTGSELEALAERLRELVRKHPEKAAIVLTDWLRLDGDRQRKTG